MDHKQVRVAWGDDVADIDEELAPLILALWKAGIRTTNSCQENRSGVAWVEFLTPRDAKAFLDRVAVYPRDAELASGGVQFWETLYGRITNCGGEGDWEYAVDVRDWGVEEELVKDEVVVMDVGPADFDFFVSIRFPRTDLPLILDRFQQLAS